MGKDSRCPIHGLRLYVCRDMGCQGEPDYTPAVSQLPNEEVDGRQESNMKFYPRDIATAVWHHDMSIDAAEARIDALVDMAVEQEKARTLDDVTHALNQTLGFRDPNLDDNPAQIVAFADECMAAVKKAILREGF